MKRIKYFIIVEKRIDIEHPQILVDVLNRYGSEGWELNHIFPVGEYDDMYIFKQETN